MALKFMDELVLKRIDALLNHIDLVINDTQGLSVKDLKINDLLVRATSFSVAQIGELMVQLEKCLSPIYKDLPWKLARGMRNMLVHDYGHADLESLDKTIKEDLPVLKEQFLKIKTLEENS